MGKVNREIDPVLRRLLSAGAPTADAIRIALHCGAVERGLSTDRHSRGAIPQFAARHQLDRANLTNSIYNGRPATPPMLDALVEELGGTPEEWRVLLWKAAEPIALAG